VVVTFPLDDTVTYKVKALDGEEWLADADGSIPGIADVRGNYDGLYNLTEADLVQEGIRAVEMGNPDNACYIGDKPTALINDGRASVVHGEVVIAGGRAADQVLRNTGAGLCNEAAVNGSQTPDSNLVGVFPWDVIGGGLFQVSTSKFQTPTMAEIYAAFTSNLGYDYSFPNGGTITFTGSVPSGGDIDLSFAFEKAPYPDNYPYFDAGEVTVSGDVERSYTVEFGAQGDTVFTYFLMRIVDRDQIVVIKDLVVTDINGARLHYRTDDSDDSDGTDGN
jgi:hypothetical protein